MADNAERRITMSDRLERTAPYNLFFNVVEKSPETAKQVNAIMFKDLLCPSLGSIKCALLTTLNLNVEWLLSEFTEIGLSSPTLTILVDNIDDSFRDEEHPNLTVIKIELNNDESQIGYRRRHHSKLGLFVYDDDSIRVMVSTANLTEADWLECNQGLWLSHRLPKLPKNDESTYEPSTKKTSLENNKAADPPGDSDTRFKSDFLRYLKSYKEASQLTSWIKYVEDADFSKVKVAFIYSVPGKHDKNSNGSHSGGMENMLSKHYKSPLPNGASWDIIAQASSYSVSNSSEWLEGAFLCTMTSQNTPKAQTSGGSPKVKVIFPRERNVNESSSGGTSVFFNNWNNCREQWITLRKHFYHWKAGDLHRTRIMPHIKTYCRVSPEHDKIGYYLLTSANISKGAWGTPWTDQNLKGKKNSYNILHYEAGVLFLPKFFQAEYFAIQRTEQSIPIMYDFPLVPYDTDDLPGGRRNNNL